MFVNEDNLEAVLEVFSLEEVLEMCNVTELEVLEYLIDSGKLELPPLFDRFKVEDNYVND